MQGHPNFCKQVISPLPGLMPIIHLNTQRARVVTKTRGVFTGGAGRAARATPPCGAPAVLQVQTAGRTASWSPALFPRRWTWSTAPLSATARWGPGCKGNLSLNLTAICFP